MEKTKERKSKGKKMSDKGMEYHETVFRKICSIFGE